MLVDEKDARRDISFVYILTNYFFSFFFLNWWLAWCTAASQEIMSIYLSFYTERKKMLMSFWFCLDVCFPSATVNTHFGLCADCVQLQRHGTQATQMLIQVSDRYFSIQAYFIWFIFHLFSYNIWFFFFVSFYDGWYYSYSGCFHIGGCTTQLIVEMYFHWNGQHIFKSCAHNKNTPHLFRQMAPETIYKDLGRERYGGHPPRCYGCFVEVLFGSDTTIS